MSIVIRSFSEPSQHHASAQGLGVSILEKRKAENKHPMDSLQGKFDNIVGKELEKSCITAIQLKLSFAAIHTSAAALTQLLYDLFAMPEHTPFIFSTFLPATTISDPAQAVTRNVPNYQDHTHLDGFGFVKVRDVTIDSTSMKCQQNAAPNSDSMPFGMASTRAPGVEVKVDERENC
ncbi:hypothetical protein MMC22_008102 [Lobaria immixta]|nr:hypothetical protein [Lobaria immixta]